MKFVALIISMIIVFILNTIFYRKGINHGMKYSIDKTMELFIEALYIKFNKENKSKGEQIKFIEDLQNIIDRIV